MQLIRKAKALFAKLGDRPYTKAIYVNLKLKTCRDTEVHASLEMLVGVLETEIKQLEKRIRDFIDQHPDMKQKKELLESIKGFGEKTAIHIMAELYDLADYGDAKAAAADVGITSSHYQSGTSVRRRSKMSRMGKAAVRSALYYPAITAIQHNPIVKQLAQRLEAKGKRKAVIRVAAMRKLMHLAYGVLKNKQPFDPAYGVS